MTNISGTQSAAKLQKTLGLWHIIIIGLAYIQPMTLFDTFGLVSEESNFHVPTSYIFARIAILLTSLSYGNMIGRYECGFHGGVVILARLFIVANGQHHSCRHLPRSPVP